MPHNNSYEPYQFETWGPKVRWDVNPPNGGIDGKSVYQLYAFNDNNDIHLETFNESGAWRIINDRGIEIVAGAKGSTETLTFASQGLLVMLISLQCKMEWLK